MFKKRHTLAAGLFFAVMYERRGLISCIVFHTAFKGLGLLLGMNKHLASAFAEVPMAAKYIVIPAALIFGYAVLVPKNKNQEDKYTEQNDLNEVT